MTTLDRHLIEWVCHVVGADDPVEVRGLRDGGAPWLLRFDGRDVVLRTGSDPAVMRIEHVGLHVAATNGVAVPHVVGVDFEHDPPVLLTEAVQGSSSIPLERPVTRLRVLGATAAALHRIDVAAELALPRRTQPIAGVDFAALRAAQPARRLLTQAEEIVRAYGPSGADGFVHGDFWQGNSMWDADTLTGLIDWDCAGVGAAGVDLGSLRCDAAICFDLPAADDVLAGWEDDAGRAAEDVAYWDIVAALSTPPDMGWFVQALHGQGRPDLTRTVLVERRDKFLGAALSQF